MNFRKLYSAMKNRPRHWEAKYLQKRLLKFKSKSPIISFSFDDSPASSYHNIKSILNEHNIKVSYYISTGLLSKTIEVGTILSKDDLKDIVENGHELGCHTSKHGEEGKVTPYEYEKHIIENKKTIGQIIPNYKFETFAYPYGYANYKFKKITEKYFSSSRGTYSGINNKLIDTNLLKANQLFCDDSKESFQSNINRVKNLINKNKTENGWLIFYTHDVSNSPQKYGCTIRLFSEIIRLSVESGAKILPIKDVFKL